MAASAKIQWAEEVHQGVLAAGTRAHAVRTEAQGGSPVSKARVLKARKCQKHHEAETQSQTLSLASCSLIALV